MAPFNVRYALCEDLTKNHPWLHVCDFEQRIQSSKTALTLQKMAKKWRNTHFVWLMGMDNVHSFHRWHRWQDILHTVPIVVIPRAEQSHIGAMRTTGPAFNRFRKYRKKPFDPIGKAPQWRILPVRPHGGRATDIRQQLQSGETPIFLTPRQLLSPQLHENYCKTA